MIVNVTPQRANFILQAGTAAGLSPLDATTYHFGSQLGFNPTGSESGFSAFMPRAGRITRVTGVFLVLGTLGTTEQFTIAMRNTTADTTENITTTLQANAVNNTFTNNAMTLTFSAGDQIGCQFTTPTWATNPTTVFVNLTIEVEFT